MAENCALLGRYAANGGSVLTASRCVMTQKSTVLISDSVRCLSEACVINYSYSVEQNNRLFKIELRLYVYATQRNGLASINITYIYILYV